MEFDFENCVETLSNENCRKAVMWFLKPIQNRSIRKQIYQEYTDLGMNQPDKEKERSLQQEEKIK